MSAKNAILKAKLEGVIYEVLVKTNAANVMVDSNTTLAAKLTSILADIATKANTSDMTAALAAKAEKSHTHAQSEITGLTDLLATLATSESVTSAIDALRQEMLGDTPVEAYNTFTELAAYIAEHKEAADALTAAVGNKADKATTLAGYGITDAYTASEVDKKIADAVSSATGGESAASVKTALDAYKTSNDARVKAIEDAHLKAADKAALETTISDGDKTTLSQAKTYADGLNTAMDTRVDALEADTHTHSNKTVLDGITTAKVTAWDDKANIYYSTTEPASLTDGDLWVQIVE